MAQTTQDQYAAQGFQLIQLIIQDSSGGEADTDELASWAERYSLTTVPVLTVPAGYQWYPNGLYWRYEADMYIPTFVHLGPDMTVLSVDQMVTDPGSFIE